MKVCILVQYPLDANNILGGVEAAISYVLPDLIKTPGLQFHIVTCIEGLPEPKSITRDGLTITYLPRKRLGRVTFHYREIRAMLSVLREIKPDLVHAHGSGLYAGAALASKLPAVITVHGIIGEEARLVMDWRHRLRAWLDSQYERSVVRHAKNLIVISPYVERVFAKLIHGKTYLIENACDKRFFDVQRKPVKGRLLLAGMVIPRKGVLPLLQALSLVRQKLPEAHLRIAGSTQVQPAYAQACETYVHQAGLSDAVRFLGQLNQEQLLQEYATCAAFALPSFQETAPVALEQAMAAGVPSVVTATGGVPWMIEDGVTGYIVPVPPYPAGDPQALAEALLRVLSDADAAHHMGRRAAQEARQRFHPQELARRTAAVYQDVFERGMATRRA